MRRSWLSFVTAVAALAVCAEMVLRVLPVSTATMTGYHHDPDLLTYPSGHAWTSATGWDLRNPQRLQANNWGFAASHDFVPDADAVALIGDSYVEASMLAQTERPAAQLEALLGGQRKVYALGTPGTAMLDYAQRIRFASEQFRVRDFVVLMEGGDARQALCASGNVVSRCLDPATLQPTIQRQAQPGALARIARHSALAQYLMSQLRFKPATVLTAMFTRTPPEEPSRSKAGTDAGPAAPSLQQQAQSQAMVDAVVQEFFARIPRSSIRRLVFVVDGRRTGPQSKLGLLDMERQHLIERLRANGATVHDLEQHYAEHAARSRRSLSVGPYDGHLNALGVHLAMSAAASSLR